MTSDPVDNLRKDFIISVSVLGTMCLLLILAVIILIIWSYKLSKKIKNFDPLHNFKLQRPRINHERDNYSPKPYNRGLDNPHFVEDSLNRQSEKRDLNPIALRSKASIDNGNFIFGNSSNYPSHQPNNMLSNSFKNLDYMESDSRFY